MIVSTTMAGAAAMIWSQKREGWVTKRGYYRRGQAGSRFRSLSGLVIGEPIR